MARTGLIESNERKKKLCQHFSAKRKALKDVIMDRDLPMTQRFTASTKLAKLPRNSSPVRIRRRCEETGRPRGVHRFCKLGRIALRERAVQGLMPGIRRSSW